MQVKQGGALPKKHNFSTVWRFKNKKKKNQPIIEQKAKQPARINVTKKTPDIVTRESSHDSSPMFELESLQN
jgi:hypothetical protein